MDGTMSSYNVFIRDPAGGSTYLTLSETSIVGSPFSQYFQPPIENGTNGILSEIFAIVPDPNEHVPAGPTIHFLHSYVLTNQAGVPPGTLTQLRAGSIGFFGRSPGGTQTTWRSVSFGGNTAFPISSGFEWPNPVIHINYVPEPATAALLAAPALLMALTRRRPTGRQAHRRRRALVVNDPVGPNLSYLPKSANEESIHISGNVFNRYNWKIDEWQEPYSSQWDLTFDFENTAEHEDPPSGQANYPTVLQRTNAWTMPEGDTIEDAEDVEAIVLANAGCRLPTSQPALDDYDALLVEAHGRNGVPAQDPTQINVVFPDLEPENDGHPGTPELIYPLNGALELSTTLTLEWARADETDRYDVFVGTTNPPTVFAGTTIETTFQVTDLSSSTVYYWQVWAADSCPNLTGSAVRQFATGS